MRNWFVFYVKTGKEDEACRYLNDLLDKEESISFVPQVELVYKKTQQIVRILSPMFPSYIFVESNREGKKFIAETLRVVKESKNIIKLLGKEEPEFMSILDEEKEFLLNFCNNDYTIKESTGYIKGDKVFVTSGPLRGSESSIKKVDRHKRRAEIEIMMMGEIRRVSLSLEIISKI